MFRMNIKDLKLNRTKFWKIFWSGWQMSVKDEQKVKQTRRGELSTLKEHTQGMEGLKTDESRNPHPLAV